MPRAKRTEAEAYTLRLYVAGTSERSMRAILNARELLDEYLPGRYKLEVVDIF